MDEFHLDPHSTLCLFAIGRQFSLHGGAACATVRLVVVVAVMRMMVLILALVLALVLVLRVVLRRRRVMLVGQAGHTWLKLLVGPVVAGQLVGLAELVSLVVHVRLQVWAKVLLLLLLLK